MARRLMGIISVIVICGVLVSVFWGQPTFAAQVFITDKDSSVEVNPEKLFNVENMAPGYRGSSELTIKNNGQYDYSYSIKAVFKDGDQIMFDVLMIEIKDVQGNLIYPQGKLNELTNYSLGSISAGQQNQYSVSVYFPGECGNEYQGKKANVDFIISSSMVNISVVFEPPFNHQNFKPNTNSTVPIKFHLENQDGSIVKKERDLQLIIKGPDANGKEQEYTFSKQNGELRFAEHHYMAQLLSKYYSLMVGGSYTAIVKAGNTILATRHFEVDDAPDTSRNNISVE